MEGKVVPTKEKERLLELDVLRGIALFGILVVNMSYFSTPALLADILGLSKGEGLLNEIVVIIVTVAFEFKFVSLFSFLFGVGFALFLSRLENKEVHARSIYRRRIRFLLVVGLIHLFFFWYGDILTLYALIAFLLPFYLNKKSRTLLVWSGALLIMPLVLLSLLLLVGFDSGGSFPKVVGDMYDQALYAYANGSAWEIFLQRLVDIAMIYQGYILMAPVILGLFLLGMYAWQSRLIANAKQHIGTMKRIRNYSFCIGFPFALLSIWAQSYVDYISSPYYVIQYIGYSVSGPALALFYISAIYVCMQSQRFRVIIAFFQPVGRMAFTNYLLQTLICTSLFYSYGLGLFGKIEAAAGFLLAVIIFIFQIFISRYWLSRNKMGPMEWLWRKYTYYKV
ncbi:DUF418 domain-containing protein [Halalkalibacter sp. APA_J-10(15)]|uniref:DUF418 domain-containing protein n=1 Tax=Halalkalibacter sp. APA_J-10(15) TaxID=2933805 RepID=UPI001FF43205|nr:DUF418 domain-containing protein [Halalkalibacter sp. APA_J-10(15)]MCK0471775.1 DUF418 domain-containing protein [Halalkalibacter sp. APA_J-10(15)]